MVFEASLRACSVTEYWFVEYDRRPDVYVVGTTFTKYWNTSRVPAVSRTVPSSGFVIPGYSLPKAILLIMCDTSNSLVFCPDAACNNWKLRPGDKWKLPANFVAHSQRARKRETEDWTRLRENTVQVAPFVSATSQASLQDFSITLFDLIVGVESPAHLLVGSTNFLATTHT